MAPYFLEQPELFLVGTGFPGRKPTKTSPFSDTSMTASSRNRCEPSVDKDANPHCWFAPTVVEGERRLLPLRFCDSISSAPCLEICPLRFLSTQNTWGGLQVVSRASRLHVFRGKSPGIAKTRILFQRPRVGLSTLCASTWAEALRAPPPLGWLRGAVVRAAWSGPCEGREGVSEVERGGTSTTQVGCFIDRPDQVFSIP